MTKKMTVKYLRIKNQGVAPLESFTTLGLSTSAGSGHGVIGQFGSGAKHGINLLLRNGRVPTVTLGEVVVTFGTVLKTIHAPDGSKVYEQATIIVDGAERELGYTLDYGSFDWDEVTMALREFISNAIDMTVKLCGTYQDSTLDLRIVDSISPVSGATCIFVPADDAVQSYVREIGKYFLHFSGETFDYGTMRRDFGVCRLYREGVFVRDLDDLSLFDYNFPASQIKIDESRNLDDYRARCYVQSYLEDSIDVSDACVVLESLRAGKDSLELDRLGSSWSLERPHSTWVAAVERVFDDHDVLCLDNSMLVARVVEEGYHPVVVSSSLMPVLKAQGMKAVTDVLSRDKCEGYTIVESNDWDQAVASSVWDGMETLDLCAGIVMPEIRYFKEGVDGMGTRKLGFVEEGVVYINECLRGESIKLRGVLVEEFVHLLSKCDDCTRGFQTFCCEALATAMHDSDS